MKVGDIVKFTLYDKEQTGTVIKVHRENGWKGYVDILLTNRKEIIMPVSILSLV